MFRPDLSEPTGPATGTRSTRAPQAIPGIRSVAAPVIGSDGRGSAALAVVFVGAAVAVGDVGKVLSAAAGQLAAELR